MKEKRLTQFSIGFVAVIFLSQTYLIWKLFLVNKDFLNREINLVCQEAYTTDMNSRFRNGSKENPWIEFEDAKDAAPDPNPQTTTKYDVDKMENVDKSNYVTIVNIAIETYLSKVNPLKLSSIDSLANILLDKKDIHKELYSRIINLENDSILACSKKGSMSESFFEIKSKSIPLNFQKTKGLQLVMVNPMNSIFSQMTGMLFLSFLFSLFCIYWLFILQKTLSRQKKLTQSKTDFYNQVSHELKRPVTVIYKAIDSLLSTPAIENKVRREKYLKLSMDELSQMNSKIDMILTISMEEEGMFKLSLSNMNIVEMIQEIEEKAQLTLDSENTLIISNKLTNPIIFADKDHLYQCISNLIDNAVKYSGKDLKIEIALTEDEKYVNISVKDNGIGISETNLKNIFVKFERIDSGKKVHGYGIGLSYVKKIIEKHGGIISVNSALGKGSEFILKIPKIHSI
jgi:two-component system, OmpR family, phosphate regulon sensor histidine kinase PhoR